MYVGIGAYADLRQHAGDMAGQAGQSELMTALLEEALARAMVKVPPDFIDLKEMLTVTPDEVEEAFVKVNSGLTRDAIAVEYLYEGKKLKFVDTAGLRKKFNITEKLEHMAGGDSLRTRE